MNLSVEETFGLTTAEALSCGIPSIVYNSTACPEIVDENTGFIIEKHQLNDLMNAIDVIKKRGKHFYSIACRQRVVRLYNKKQKFEEIFFFIYELVEKNKMKPAPYSYQICTNCVMDTSDPNITFDENGICDHCHDFQNNVKPNWHNR